VPFLAWGPLGGASRARALGTDSPTAAFAGIGERHAATAAEVTLAWLLSLSPTVWVIPGMRRIESVHSTLRAVDLVLTVDEARELDDAVATDALGRQRLARLRAR
jgi:pyridoxine 4-dehydrogenase